MTASLSVLAVDDELPPLEDLARILREDPRIAAVETVLNSREAMAKASDATFDAIFLDVRMPGLDGVELGRAVGSRENPPALVFVTAFDDAAVAAFELRAVDYLLKPVTPERVAEAIERVASWHGAPAQADAESSPWSSDPETLAVENIVGGGTRRISASSVLFMEARGDYMRVVTDRGRYLLRGYPGQMHQRLGRLGFLRVHRGYVANLRRAVELRPLKNGTGELVFENDARIPIARRKLPALRKLLHR